MKSYKSSETRRQKKLTSLLSVKLFVQVASFVLTFHLISLLNQNTGKYLRNLIEADGSVECSIKMNQIAVACHAYHAKTGALPSRYLTGSDGSPSHSWRVLISPYIGLDTIFFSKYRFDESWDGPHNKLLHSVANDAVIPPFHCPSDPSPPGQASYLAISDNESLLRNNPPFSFLGISETRYAKNSELIAGSAGRYNAILAVESHSSGIHWMEPRDLDSSKLSEGVNSGEGSVSGMHQRWRSGGEGPGAAVVFVDGNVRYLSSKTDPKLLRRLLEIDNPDKPKEKYISP